MQNCYRKVKNLYGKIMNLSGNMKEFIWKKYGKVKNLYRNVKDLLRHIYIYVFIYIYIWKNDEFDWTSERNCMAKIWKSEEFVWKREGFIKKSEEFLWKNDEFVWKSERIYMAQRYSKYRFFDVNCILSILFQVQLWGCPGKPKFQFATCDLCTGPTPMFEPNVLPRSLLKH